MNWSAEIGCEGGPVLVANARDFRGWTGADPLPASERKELLYYSPFSAELPPKFRVGGSTGHIYLPCADPWAMREELVTAVMALDPRAKVDNTRDTWIVTRGDGKRLHASLEPSSEYSRATRHLDQDGSYSWGDGLKCYLWSIGPGIVRLSVRNNRTELVLSQMEYSDEDEHAALAYAYAENEGESQPTGATYEITKGPAVVAWSPCGASDLNGGVDLEAPSRTSPGRLLDLATDESGALVWLEPGAYEASSGYHGSETWGVSWCKLTLIRT